MGMSMYGNDTGLVGHQIDQPVGEAEGIDVEQPEPRNGGLAQQGLEQIG